MRCSASPCFQATVLCDLLLLHILPKRHYYKQKKFKYAEDMGPEAVRDHTVPFRSMEWGEEGGLGTQGRERASSLSRVDLPLIHAHTGGGGPCSHRLHLGPAGEHEDVLTPQHHHLLPTDTAPDLGL